MHENGTKFLTVVLAAILVMTMISLTTFNGANVIQVLAQEQEDREVGEVSQQDCAELVDEIKELDREDILELAEDNGEELQDLRLSVIMCSATGNLEKPLEPDALDKLDPAVIAVLGPDIIGSLIRQEQKCMCTFCASHTEKVAWKHKKKDP